MRDLKLSKAWLPDISRNVEGDTWTSEGFLVSWHNYFALQSSHSVITICIHTYSIHIYTCSTATDGPETSRGVKSLIGLLIFQR